jgi:hypothetical protein
LTFGEENRKGNRKKSKVEEGKAAIGVKNQNAKSEIGKKWKKGKRAIAKTRKWRN